MIWLSRIDAHGIAVAMRLKPEECDELQALVEAETSSWHWSLAPMLGQNSEFDPYEVVGFNSETFDRLGDGDFLYLSVSNNDGLGHAMALYRHAAGTIFFNPGGGMFLSKNSADKSEVVKSIQAAAPWATDFAVRKGTMRTGKHTKPRFANP